MQNGRIKCWPALYTRPSTKRWMFLKKIHLLTEKYTARCALYPRQTISCPAHHHGAPEGILLTCGHRACACTPWNPPPRLYVTLDRFLLASDDPPRLPTSSGIPPGRTRFASWPVQYLSHYPNKPSPLHPRRLSQRKRLYREEISQLDGSLYNCRTITCG